MTYDLPNPFMGIGNLSSIDGQYMPNEEDEEITPIPRGYRCCPDCGTCPPCDQHCPNAAPSRFQLDEAAMLSEIEPVPAFLTRPVDEYIPVSAQQADQIEEMLKLARAEEWPAPPRRMVG